LKIKNYSVHRSVLQKEVIKCLSPKPNENFIDATIGEMGHALEILRRNGPNGKILGIDWDLKQIKNCESKIGNFQNRVILVNDSYANLKNIIEKHSFKPVNGILFDLGMSSWHLEKSGRGFTFLKDEPLDMRYNTKFSNELTAEKIVNEYPEERLEEILKEYGEEKFAKRIVREIAKERKIKAIKSTLQLVEIIKRAVPARYRFSKIHFATRTFQALRIKVNEELENLSKVLPQAVDVLMPGGRLVVISFHSLEDRIVKNFFKKNSKLKTLFKKPIVASEEEIKENSRSRSSKLRAAIKIK